MPIVAATSAVPIIAHSSSTSADRNAIRSVAIVSRAVALADRARASATCAARAGRRAASPGPDDVEEVPAEQRERAPARPRAEPARPLPTRIMKTIRSGTVTREHSGGERVDAGPSRASTASGTAAASTSCGQVAGEVGLERVDALHRGGRELAGALLRRAPAAGAPAAARPAGRAARDITRVAPIRPDISNAPASSAAQRDHAGERNERSGAARQRRVVHRGAVISGRAAPPGRPRSPRWRRRCAAASARLRPARRGSHASEPAIDPLRRRCGRHPLPCAAHALGGGAWSLAGCAQLPRLEPASARPSKSSTAEAVAEDPVGPALVEQHDRDEDHGDDRHHRQGVVVTRPLPASVRLNAWLVVDGSASGNSSRTG